MSVVTEKTIRKIIQNNIQKEGFFRAARSRSGEGDVRYMECDLSRLKKGVAAEKFAKYILLKPKFEEIVNGTKNTFTKNMIMVMLQGGLGDEQNERYDNEIEEYLRDNPDVVGNWVDMLEFSITQAFGPLSKMYCNLINTLFLTGRKPTSRDLERRQDSNGEEIAKKILRSLKKSGSDFSFVKKIVKSREGFELEHLVFFPNTFLKAEEDSENLKQIFNKEREKLRRLLMSDIEIKNIIKIFNEIFRNISGKSEFLSPIGRLSNSIESTSANNTIAKNLLIKLAQECEEKILEKFDL